MNRNIITFFEYYKNYYVDILFENAGSQTVNLLMSKYGFTESEIEIIKNCLPENSTAGDFRFIVALMQPYIKQSRGNIQDAKNKYLDFLEEDGEGIRSTIEQYNQYKSKTTLFDAILNIDPNDEKIKQELTIVDENDFNRISKIPNIKDMLTFVKDPDPLYVIKKVVDVARYLYDSKYQKKEVLKTLKEVKGRLENVFSKDHNGIKYEVWQFMDPATAETLLRDNSKNVIPGAEHNKWCLKDPRYFVSYGKHPDRNKDNNYKGPYEVYILLKNGKAYVAFDFETLSCNDVSDNIINDTMAKELAPVLGDFIAEKVKEYYKYDIKNKKMV